MSREAGTEHWSLRIDGQEVPVPVRQVHTLIVGSGAAALCCAERLHSLGVADLLILTDNLAGGTSRNTGSDKQTYYKLADAGPAPDSPLDMARALADGGCVHGDIALAEAQGSLNSFYHLVSLGVNFPHNPYGGYTGYRTDHDSRARGVSLGPYTSKAMTEALLKEVRRREIPVRDRMDALRLLTAEGRAAGVLALNKRSLDSPAGGLEVWLAENVVLGVGGPGGLYETSVYPPVHRGGIGMALEAGAAAVNLTESQFGIGSIRFRWNLSGSYQQVLPAYYSTDQDGGGRRYFLHDYFDSLKDLCRAVFLKGYQWPFDPGKVTGGGSSLIDVLVYIEREVKNRRVFMDFRENSAGAAVSGDFDPEDLDEEAREYLKASGALGGTPVERLAKLNQPAIALYRDHGIDLYREPLEIAVCAQHNNGGLAADMWWESVNLPHLFPVGEVNGSHGVCRPGGSALNAGQVGALRAASKIAHVYSGRSLRPGDVREAVLPLVREWAVLIRDLVEPGAEKQDVFRYRRDFQKRMTRSGGFIRSPGQAAAAEEAGWEQLDRFHRVRVPCRELVPYALKNRQMALAHCLYLRAVRSYLDGGGGSRGSFLVLDPQGTPVHPLLGREWRFREEHPEHRRQMQELRYRSPRKVAERRVSCRPVPERTFWFETMWKDYREGRIYDEGE